MKKHPAHILLCCLFLLFFSLSDCTYVLASSPKTSDFYFYFPDAPQNNLARLKKEMDTFFAFYKLPVNFQAFAHAADLDRAVTRKQPAFQLVPNWYYQKRKEQQNLTPLLLPVSKGKKYYTKLLLVSRKHPVALPEADNSSLATTSMGPNIHASLNSQLFASHPLAEKPLHFIEVPKDSDALLALALGQVNLAFVTRHTLEIVSELNPRIGKSVKPVLESSPIPMPVLCFTRGVAEQETITRLEELFLEQNCSEKCASILKMLQIDEWQKFTTDN